MKFVCVVLSIAILGAPSVHAEPGPAESLTTIDSFAELAGVRAWLRRIVDSPAATAHTLARMFEHLPAPDWVTRYRTESKALDLLAYYVELESARERGEALPPHPVSVRHLEFYRAILNPTSEVTRFGPVTSPALIFADVYLRSIRAEDSARTFELFGQLLRAGRPFWTVNLTEHLFVRSVPLRDELLPLMTHVRPRDFAPVARAIATHLPDFRYAQMLMNRLSDLRASRHPDLPQTTGHGPCDRMLEIAARLRHHARR